MIALIRMHRRVWAAVAAGVVIATCSACLPSFGEPASPNEPWAPSRPGPTSDAGRRTAADVLSGLPVKSKAAKTGYSRLQFGQAWTDDVGVPAGQNGCNGRDDILRRDLSNVVVDSKSRGCTVTAGTLHDPYTGRTIAFTKGNSTSAAVQIDHLVPLGDAWVTGGQQLSAPQRADLANDPLELMAVDGPTNERKGDGDAATWLPPNHSYRCAYAARQIAVKTKYRLWVTAPEKAALTRVLATCPIQVLPEETDLGVAVPAPAQL